MAEVEDPQKPRRTKPRQQTAPDLEEELTRLQATLRETQQAPSKEDERATAPVPDDIQDLADEEAAIEKEADSLKKQRELERELAKFTANALDRASTSLLTLGLIGPGVGFLYHTTLLATLTDSELVVATISCLGLAFVLHSMGRAVLNEVFLR
ncbi:hypothetical protein EOA13_00390 [Mesorhizobium sp. M7A.F.Ca.US.011.01.1.1]|uniref:hypothetical protein n=1 Tax=Mesorhizobium sp. M7A.F.Ca.US.011.01.1.1 TaxID=2496741 RepID=UPI000FCC9B22|nr:hypothetical protein [Mesorhizobium sp. M7A.F.Ca.US.011.01.1.1]RUX32602.1 hypothetical protein EOA13_00390 [Mesorhizobium sp. M7A.F.Ca.US.011.01.1.1]